jgi:hypothetical protein
VSGGVARCTEEECRGVRTTAVDGESHGELSKNTHNVETVRGLLAYCEPYFNHRG